MFRKTVVEPVMVPEAAVIVKEVGPAAALVPAVTAKLTATGELPRSTN